MTDPTLAPVEDKGLIARAIGMVIAPGETYRTVVKYPRPAFILLLVCLVLALATALPQFTERGRLAALEMQIQQTEKFMPVTPEMAQGMERNSHYGGYITLASTFIMLPIFTLLFSAIYWGVFNAILGGTAKFKQVLGVVSHSQVIMALGAAAGAPIQLATGKMTATGPFSLGALAPMLEPNGMLANFLGSIAVFQVWGTIVCAIGLGTLYNRKSRNIAITLLAIYALFAAGWAYFTSGR
jgi:hypothetical protein